MSKSLIVFDLEPCPRTDSGRRTPPVSDLVRGFVLARWWSSRFGNFVYVCHDRRDFFN
jgi:hypothetical protein